MEHSLSNAALRRQYQAAGFGGRVGWGSPRPAGDRMAGGVDHPG